MKKVVIAWILSLVLVLSVVGVAGAITDGELDGDGHPYVGLMVALDADGEALWRCSGTLISETIFLTAGHCTESPAEGARVYFDSDVQSLLCTDPDAGPGDDCYPYGGGDSHTGTPYTHPQYNPNAFYLYDLGVVVLDDALDLNVYGYGVLPQQDVLDQMAKRRGKQDVTFTAVGYGLQRINPVFVEAERVRMVAYPKLNQINAPGFTGDFSLLLSNNHSTGGTCFGDSGGPNFINDTNVVGGVTSFGLNGNCAGTGGVYRVDRADDLDWLANYFGVYPPAP